MAMLLAPQGINQWQAQAPGDRGGQQFTLIKSALPAFAPVHGHRHDHIWPLGLLAVLQQDLNFGGSKKLYLDILAALPKGDSVASQYRRKLYSLLY